MSRISSFRGAALAGVTLVTLAAGCTSPTGAPSATGTTPAPPTTGSASPTANPAGNPGGSYEQRSMAWGRRLAKCAREHGFTDFPDPQFIRDQQDVDFPVADKGELERALTACRQVLREKPPRPPDKKPPSAQRLAQMRKYSACMRQHGVSEFPDPKANGTFPVLGTKLDLFRPGDIAHLPPAVDRAYGACWNLQHDWRMASLLS